MLRRTRKQPSLALAFGHPWPNTVRRNKHPLPPTGASPPDDERLVPMDGSSACPAHRASSAQPFIRSRIRSPRLLAGEPMWNNPWQLQWEIGRWSTPMDSGRTLGLWSPTTSVRCCGHAASAGTMRGSFRRAASRRTKRPKQALFRELHEEVGLDEHCVKILACTSGLVALPAAEAAAALQLGAGFQRPEAEVVSAEDGGDRRLCLCDALRKAGVRRLAMGELLVPCQSGG